MIRTGGQVCEFKSLQAEMVTEIKSFVGRCFTHETKSKCVFILLPDYVFSPSVVVVAFCLNSAISVYFKCILNIPIWTFPFTVLI